MSQSLYTRITDQILAALRDGVVPWRQPWTSAAPANALSKHVYRGINVLVLRLAAQRAGYCSPYWLTLRQAKVHGGKVLRGERSTPVVYWHWREVSDDADPSSSRLRPFPRLYHVFNVEQTEGIDLGSGNVPTDAALSDSLGDFVESLCHLPRIRYGFDHAAYYPVADEIRIPHPVQFGLTDLFGAVLFHEMVHSTGHPDRLSRVGIVEKHTFGDPVYSKEELVAEIGSAFLCAEAGISPEVLPHSTSYIENWLRVLGGDTRLILEAASAAQRAVDYLHGQEVTS